MYSKGPLPMTHGSTSSKGRFCEVWGFKKNIICTVAMMGGMAAKTTTLCHFAKCLSMMLNFLSATPGTFQTFLCPCCCFCKSWYSFMKKKYILATWPGKLVIFLHFGVSTSNSPSSVENWVWVWRRWDGNTLVPVVFSSCLVIIYNFSWSAGNRCQDHSRFRHK